MDDVWTKKKTEKQTAATSVYHALKHDIVLGLLGPGYKLQIDQIADRYNVGTNPVREALNRLSAERLVDREDLRGFFVPPISITFFRELVKTRCWLEGKALSESILNRNDAWEDAIVLANHRLQRTPPQLSEIVGETTVMTINPEWELRHSALHRALIANCGSSILRSFCSDMMIQNERYRHIAMAHSFPRRRNNEEHQKIVDAALNGEIDRAVDCLIHHYELTLKIFEQNFSTD